MFASGSPFPPAIGLFGRAFGARGRIRIRDMMGRWLIVAMAWITSVGEQLRRRADADDAGRPQLLHRLDEGGNRRTILGERRLEGGEIAARAHQSRYWTSWS